ncbi:MAG TPA: aminoacyl-tRNA hydrolase [Candidatus Saccharimonadales bacterium]|nr:aminoacyl-tRNA hydrolase [Candidatus Saccharimonadales bacterium]
MGWLQRRPQVSDNASFYTIGLNKTLLITGLGNPEPKYDLTRHNIGFYCIDEFVDKTDEMSNWVLKKNFKAFVSEGNLNATKVIAIKPTTYMNLSGEAVQAVASFYHISPEHILAVHDDLDITFGQIRLRVGGSSGGHNGIKSITKAIGEHYGRVRIGIGPKTPDQMPTEDFVLQKFNKQELAELPALSKETLSILSEYIFGGSLPQDTRNFLL